MCQRKTLSQSPIATENERNIMWTLNLGTTKVQPDLKYVDERLTIVTIEQNHFGLSSGMPSWPCIGSVTESITWRSDFSERCSGMGTLTGYIHQSYRFHVQT